MLSTFLPGSLEVREHLTFLYFYPYCSCNFPDYLSSKISSFLAFQFPLRKQDWKDFQSISAISMWTILTMWTRLAIGQDWQLVILAESYNLAKKLHFWQKVTVLTKSYILTQSYIFEEKLFLKKSYILVGTFNFSAKIKTTVSKQ